MASKTTRCGLIKIAQQISQRFPNIQLVAMTRREGISATHNNFGGLLYDSSTGTTHWTPTESSLYQITNIVDRLGAGDAFTAALVYAFTTPDLAAPELALPFATAAGCLAHSIEGDFNYVSRTEIEALVAGNASGRVNR